MCVAVRDVSTDCYGDESMYLTKIQCLYGDFCYFVLQSAHLISQLSWCIVLSRKCFFWFYSAATKCEERVVSAVEQVWKVDVLVATIKSYASNGQMPYSVFVTMPSH